MNINLENRLYKTTGGVYFGTIQKPVHEQRGRRFVSVGKKQIHVDNIPELPVEKDCVFDYIFGGGSRTHPCPAMEFWIYRHRLKNKITIKGYKEKFKVIVL